MQAKFALYKNRQFERKWLCDNHYSPMRSGKRSSHCFPKLNVGDQPRQHPGQVFLRYSLDQQKLPGQVLPPLPEWPLPTGPLAAGTARSRGGDVQGQQMPQGIHRNMDLGSFSPLVPIIPCSRSAFGGRLNGAAIHDHRTRIGLSFRSQS